MKKSDLIFVVEDDQYYSFALLTFLQSLGFSNIECFTSGKECLAHSYMMPKLVLLDYNLSDSKGIEIMLELISFDSNTPVVFISAQDSVQLAINTLKYGAYDYIQKDEGAFPKLKDIISRIKKGQDIIKRHEQRMFLQRFSYSALVISILTIIAVVNF